MIDGLRCHELSMLYIVARVALDTAETPDQVRLIRRTYTGKHGLFTRAINLNAKAIRNAE